MPGAGNGSAVAHLGKIIPHHLAGDLAAGNRKPVDKPYALKNRAVRPFAMQGAMTDNNCLRRGKSLAEPVKRLADTALSRL